MKHRFLLRKPQIISDERYWKVQIKVVTEEYKYEQDRCFKVAVTPGTWNWGGRNGRQQWILPVCLLPIPQSQDTRWMFSCHIYNYTLEIISDKIQATLLTICISLPLRLICCILAGRMQKAGGSFCMAEQAAPSPALASHKGKMQQGLVKPLPFGWAVC